MTVESLPVSHVEGRPASRYVLLFAAQHVLAMYAGAVTVPLAIAGAAHLPMQQTAYLISAGLLASGLVTLIQCLGIGNIGVRLPVIMGATFVGVMPASAMVKDPAIGLPGVFGAAIVAGIVCFALVPYTRRLRVVFTPAVTGTAMLLIGLSLIGVAGNWIFGDGAALGTRLALAGFTFCIILACIRFGKGAVSSGAVFIGLAAGMAMALVTSQASLSGISQIPFFSRAIQPFYFGLPRFVPSAIVSMTLVMLITLVESSGMLLLLGTITENPLDQDRLGRGLKADALGAVIGGLCNSFPCTSYSQNIALVSMTGVRSRFVCAAAGVMLVAMAFFPRLSGVVAALPPPVLGGAGLLLFGSVAAAGIRLLSELDFSRGTDATVVGIGLALGTLPAASPGLIASLPSGLGLIFGNGMLVGVTAAILASAILRRDGLS